MSDINLLAKSGFICDMDGVIYHGNVLLPGASRADLPRFSYRPTVVLGGVGEIPRSAG